MTSSVGYSDSVDQVSAKLTAPHALFAAKWLSHDRGRLHQCRAGAFQPGLAERRVAVD